MVIYRITAFIFQLLFFRRNFYFATNYVLLFILCHNSYLYIKAVKSFIYVPREKLRPRRTISRMSKDFAAKVYTTFFVQPKTCNYYKSSK
jgi:hypothetical protein